MFMFMLMIMLNKFMVRYAVGMFGLCLWLWLYLGVDYIHGEMMFGHKHATVAEVGMNHENRYRNHEAHIFVGETKHVSEHFVKIMAIWKES